LAIKKGNLEILQKLWEWAENKLTAEVLRDEIYQNHKGKNRLALGSTEGRP
jgi:hypothetical protein